MSLYESLSLRFLGGQAMAWRGGLPGDVREFSLLSVHDVNDANDVND